MINILSTPMARIRKGMTYPLIIVKPIPMYEITPILEKTEANTMIIPTIDKVNPDATLDGNCPIAIPM